jgi:hypothetical protein
MSNSGTKRLRRNFIPFTLYSILLLVLSDEGMLEDRNMELVHEESNILVCKTVAKTHMGDQDIDGMVILK